MKKGIVQKQQQSKYPLGSLVTILKSPYTGIEFTDGIIVSYAETGVAQVICMVNGKDQLLAFYDGELQDNNVNPNSYEAQGYPPY